jgi:glycosyl transferase family 87
VIEKPPAWIISAAAWLKPSRVRAQALLLALCLWGVCVIDFATPGLFDRAGNIKFQDFLPSYISARLIAQGRAAELYSEQVAANAIQALIGQPSRVRLPNLYGPQVGLLFVPLARFSFPIAARIWVATSLFIYFGCIYVIWKSCPNLRPRASTVAICAIAFPPLFHFFVRGQTSALALACFTAAYFAFRADRKWLAGFALGFLFFKPQFLVAIPIVLLLARAWKEFLGLVVSASAQFALAKISFGPVVMHAYFDALRNFSRGGVELSLAPIQMHSLRSFWTLLIPQPELALTFYVLSSVVVIALAASVWKSPAPLAIRFSALTLAAVLVNPHLFVYDLLVLAPALLLLVDWTLIHEQSATSGLRLLLYFAYVLPLFGPLSRWTHVQLSVPSFVAVLWVLLRGRGTTNEEQASSLTPLQ